MLFALLIIPLRLEASDLQTGLNGFKLLQNKKVVEVYFGNPFNKTKTKDSIVEAHAIDNNAYMVFEYKDKFPNFICTIQYTGLTSVHPEILVLTLEADQKSYSIDTVKIFST